MATKENAQSGAKTLKTDKEEVKDVTSKQASGIKGGGVPINQPPFESKKIPPV